MLDKNVSRRTALKAGGLLAVAAATAPYMIKGVQSSGIVSAEAATQVGSANSGNVATSAVKAGKTVTSNEPLILMVKGSEVSVYQGTSETKFVDGQLSSTLLAKFAVGANPLGGL
jgi:hypothetical protein